MNAYSKAADQYLAQKVASATPEELVAMLLEAGQRFIAHGLAAMEKRDHATKGRHLHRVLQIIEELHVRLDLDAGGELVMNLSRIYDWWSREVMEGGMHMEPDRLQRVAAHMGELREAWEQLAQRKKVEAASATLFVVGDLAG